MKIRQAVLTSIAVVMLLGCAHLQPNADPLVVNVERIESVAPQVFSAALSEDHANRSFWITNAPAFHSFCEWLRQPQTVLVTNSVPVTVPRDIALVLNLDNVKLSYKQGGASSNAVAAALLALQSAINQATGWLTVATNTPR